MHQNVRHKGSEAPGEIHNGHMRTDKQNYLAEKISGKSA